MYNKIIAVTNRHLCSIPFLQQIERICLRHPKAVLLREKDLPEIEYEGLLAQVQKICGQYDVLCIPHTFAGAAQRLGASSIHFPLQLLLDSPEAAASFTRIGASIHSVADAQKAQAAGATYLTAGHIFSTSCKPGLAPRGTTFLKTVCTSVSLPVYAIGGMHATKKCLADMTDCKAAGICIMSECMNW